MALLRKNGGEVVISGSGLSTNEHYIDRQIDNPGMESEAKEDRPVNEMKGQDEDNYWRNE